MNVVVSGASGLIGTALVRSLRADGHDITRLVRRTPTAGDEAQWDPATRQVDVAVVDGADAVIHLAGAGVADHRWTDEYQQTILRSRVDGTTTIASAVAEAKRPPRVLVCASAVGYYGDRGDELLDETSSRGAGFLADVVEQWEAAADPARAVGVPVVHLRTGLVLSPDGGVLGTTLPLFKLGLGGKLGSGRQWMPWIALADEIAAIRFLLDSDDSAGVYNLAAPEPVRNADYTKALGKALHRPTLATVPRVALAVALGDFAREGALVSQRAVPTRLLDAGFDFRYDDVDAALRAML